MSLCKDHFLEYNNYPDDENDWNDEDCEICKGEK